MAIETAIKELKINLLTKTQYAEALANNQINDDELYLTNIEAEIITDATSGAKSPNISAGMSNIEYRYLYASGISSLTFNSSDTFLSTTEAYYSIVFKSGSTATTITNTLSIYFKGDDCVNGNFTPVTNKTYELGVWWNGFTWQSIVRGV